MARPGCGTGRSVPAAGSVRLLPVPADGLGLQGHVWMQVLGTPGTLGHSGFLRHPVPAGCGCLRVCGGGGGGGGDARVGVCVCVQFREFVPLMLLGWQNWFRKPDAALSASFPAVPGNSHLTGMAPSALLQATATAAQEATHTPRRSHNTGTGAHTGTHPSTHRHRHTAHSRRPGKNSPVRSLMCCLKVSRRE